MIPAIRLYNRFLLIPLKYLSIIDAKVMVLNVILTCFELMLVKVIMQIYNGSVNSTITIFMA